MPTIKDAPPPASPETFRRVLASELILMLMRHQEMHPGQYCDYCRPVAIEINRRMPREED